MGLDLLTIHGSVYIFSGFIDTPWLQSVHHIVLVIMYVHMSMPSAKISTDVITK